MHYPLAILLLAGLLTGCSSTLPGRKSIPGPSAVEVYQARQEPPEAVEPALSVLPSQPVKEAPAAKLPSDPMPVWSDAQVVRVEMDAYVNEKGEAFGPSVKYVVKRPGGWNIDALRKPELSYVPTENVPPIPSRNGFTSNPMVSPGDGVNSMAADSSVQVRPLQPSLLQDPSKIRVTGFVERSQEPHARSMAKNGEIPIFDEALGWILVPQTALAPADAFPAGN